MDFNTFYALQLIVAGYEVIPLRPNGDVDGLYRLSKERDPSYKINNICEIEMYFSPPKCDVGYLEGNKIYHLITRNKTCEYGSCRVVKRKNKGNLYEQSI